MALTPFQRGICRLLAQQRIAGGESYVAGGASLNELTAGSRISRDVDLFHDSQEALEKSWAADRALLESHDYEVRVLRDRPGIVEAQVSLRAETIILQWTRDSAFRFFPLVEHDDFGLTLHPFDLATNKVLALVGRLEVRDWVDVIHCHEHVQPLGYLAWAASGKDPGFGPPAILEHAARSSHYSAAEVRELAFDGEPPDPGDLARRWHKALSEARTICAALPPDQVGCCVLTREGRLYTADPARLRVDLGSGAVRFHHGRIGGALPVVVDPTTPANR